MSSASESSGQPVHICTIAARNYLPRVKVLADSFRSTHPDGIFDLCVVDDIDDEVEPGDGINLIRLGDLSLDENQLRLMAVFYDITEFSTALKPWVMEAALKRVPGPVLYLDPDIEVFSSLEELTALASAHDIVLTPHVLEPIPRDGTTPPETLIMRAGMYNLGFLGLGQNTSGFLKWWQERLAFDCVSRPEAGLFTDQKWMDFVPSLFPHVIHRNPGCNAAYWNLHERPISYSDGRYFAGESPLVFLHYSGFDPYGPHILSKYAGNNPRVLLSTEPTLRGLCEQYGERVRRSEADVVAPEYGWNRLGSGLEIDVVMRQLVRDSVMAAAAGESSSLPDLASIDGPVRFEEWLLEETPDRGLPRYLEGLLAIRSDVEAAYPEMLRGRCDGFLLWLRSNAIRENGLCPMMVSSLDRIMSNWVPEELASPVRGAPPVVEVIGLFRAELGVGEAARRSASALRSAGVVHRTTGWHRASASRESAVAPESSLDLRGKSDVAIINVNADVLAWISDDLGPTHLHGRYRIGAWFWELSKFPKARYPAFDLVDEVWAATRFMRDAISESSPVPVVHMPVPLVAPVVADITRAELGLDERFTFLFVFDLLSVSGRKNPIGLIDAYTRAFAPGDGARLVIKTINGDQRVLDREQILIASEGRSDISVLDGYLDAGHLGALLSAADCYVSLHRSEGLGLTMAESMALGKPVIATGYSGNVDFMSPETAYLVDHTLVPVGRGNDPYDPGALWADPDLGQAAAYMREIFDNPVEAAATGARARADLERRFSPQACGRRMAQRIEQIRSDARRRG
jgi:glycosyltransferase involved in cell wall biosynthesis